MTKPRHTYRAWRDSAPLSELTRVERQERAESEARERSLAPVVRERLDALVGYEIRLLRQLVAIDGTVHRKGATYSATERCGDKIVVCLPPTKTKQPSGKPSAPTTFIMLQLDWVESTGRKNEPEKEEPKEDEGAHGSVGEDEGPSDALEA